MNIITRKPILEGWSADKKYCVTDEKGERFLLRISALEQYDAKQAEFAMMQRVASLGVPMCLPIEFGICDEGVYSIQSWIDGESAGSVIPRLSSEKQYAYGLEAGRILRRIHSIPAPGTQEDWAVRFNRKIDTKIRKYGECPIKYPKGQAFIDYVNANRYLLNGRPQTYQHGDYHIGNMMIDRSGKLYVIDFNRNDYGDPWEEFNRIVWCAQKSPRFASGMVDGYFEGEVPPEFWKLLALYISSNTLSSVYWAVPYGEKEVNTMLDQAEEVLCWYDDMRNTIPTWYVRDKTPKPAIAFRAVIFDLDGTLTDTEKYFQTAWAEAGSRMGYELNREKTLALRSLGMPFLDGQLKEWFGEACRPAEMKALCHSIFNSIVKENGVELKPGACELLARLKEKNVVIALATAGTADRANKQLTETGVIGFFDKVICSNMVSFGKPAPDTYLNACEVLGVRPEEAIAVEDSPNGVKSAHAAGCRVIMVPDQAEPEEEIKPLLYACVRSLHDIARVLFGE